MLLPQKYTTYKIKELSEFYGLSRPCLYNYRNSNDIKIIRRFDALVHYYLEYKYQNSADFLSTNIFNNFVRVL